MPRRTPDQGVRPFELRPGGDFRRLRGMNRSADPASIPDDQFHLLANVRLTPAGMTDRPGLLPSLHTSPEGAGCITGMIEVNEAGVGIAITPSPADVNSPIAAPGYLGAHYDSTVYPENMQLAIFNESKVGTVSYEDYQGREDQRADFRRYGYENLQDPPKDPTGTDYIMVLPPIPRTGNFETFSTEGGFVSLVRFRKRLLQFGYRVRHGLNATERWACLFEVELPEKDDTISVGYQLYTDLWVADIQANPELAVSDAVTVFGRSDDPLTGEELIAETMYIGRNDGRVFSYDGVTVREEVSMGANIVVRLGVSQGIGVLAIGSDAPANPPVTQTLARFLPAPGEAWSSVSVPDLLQVADIIPNGGHLYIASPVPDTNPGGWLGPRIYRFNAPGFAPFPAGAFTNIFEFTAVIGPPSEGHHLGLFFVRNGILNVVFLDSLNWWVYHRVTDTNWVKYPTEINSRGDFEGALYWVLPDAGSSRVLLAGFWYDTIANEAYKQAIVALDGWNGGPTMTTLYFNPIPLEEGPAVGVQAMVVSPEDAVLNPEEL